MEGVSGFGRRYETSIEEKKAAELIEHKLCLRVSRLDKGAAAVDISEPTTCHCKRDKVHRGL